VALRKAHMKRLKGKESAKKETFLLKGMALVKSLKIEIKARMRDLLSHEYLEELRIGGNPKRESSLTFTFGLPLGRLMGEFQSYQTRNITSYNE